MSLELCKIAVVVLVEVVPMWALGTAGWHSVTVRGGSGAWYRDAGGGHAARGAAAHPCAACGY